MNHVPRIRLAPSGDGLYNVVSSLYGTDYLSSAIPCVGGIITAEGEYLEDTSGRWRTNNPCVHYKRRWSVSGGIPVGTKVTWYNAVDNTYGTFDMKYSIPPEGSWNYIMADYAARASLPNPVIRYGAIGNPTVGLPFAGVGTSGGVSCLDPSSFPDLTTRGLRALLPGIRAAKGLSLINSIYELKDFKSLPRTYAKLQALFQKNSHGLNKLLLLARKRPRQALKELIRTAGDVYLQNEFNISPLLSDIAALNTAVWDYRKELKRLLKNTSKPITSHYSCALGGTYVNSADTQSGTLAAAFVSRPISYSRNVYYSRAKFNITLEYSYTLPSWVTQDSLWPAFLDRVGVNLSPQILWNAIPWSFVIDWFANVGSWLGQFKRRVIEPTLVIRSCCQSVNVSRSISVTSHTLGLMAAGAVLSEDAYNRQPLNDLHNSLIASGLSSHEFSLLVALAVTR